MSQLLTNRTANSGVSGHVSDHNEMARLHNLTDGIAVSVKAYGALGDGSTDDFTAIQAAITANPGARIVFTPGTYITSAPIVLSSTGTQLEGIGQVILAPKPSGWSGTQIIDVQGANNCTIRGIEFAGNLVAGAYSTSPAADCIRLYASSNTWIEDCSGYYYNGWFINMVPHIGATPIWSTGVFIQNVVVDTAKQGIHLQGHVGNTYSVNAHIENVLMGHMKAGDALFIDGCHDVYVADFEPVMDVGNTGNSIHIKGTSAGVFVIAANSGGATGWTGTSYLVEKDGSNNRPIDIHFLGGATSAQGLGMSIDCDNFQMVDHLILQSQGDGVQIVDGGTDIVLQGVEVRQSNLGGGTHYDFNIVNTTGTIILDKCTGGSLTTTVTANLASVANLLELNCKWRATTARVGTIGHLQDFVNTGNAYYGSQSGNGHFFMVGGTVLGALTGNGQLQSYNQMYPGGEAGGLQTTGGHLHSTGVPSNSNGNNKDWAISDNGRLYTKASGVWNAAAPSVNQTVIPAYFYPSGSPNPWTQLTAVGSVPPYAIANINSGPGTATTVASGSNNQHANALTSSQLHVASTTGYATSGTLMLNHSGSATKAIITYTNVSGGNTFTGCSFVSGDFILATGDTVIQYDTNYASAISSAQAAGVRVFGYVDTNYTAVTTGAAEANIDLWKLVYNLTSIFFDRVDTAAGAHQTYYATLWTYIKANGTNTLTILNPGVPPDSTYQNSGDIIVVFEGDYTTFTTTTFPSWVTNGTATSRFCALVYDVPSAALSDQVIAECAKNNIQCTYTTPDILPNPYDTISSWALPSNYLPTATWTAYTPQLIQSSAVTHSVGSARFRLVDKTMDVELDITATAAGTSTAAVTVGLPSATDSPLGSVPVFQGSAAGILGYGQCAIAGTVYKVFAQFNQIFSGTPLVTLLRTDTTVSGVIGAVAPTTALANGDRFILNLRYEIT